MLKDAFEVFLPLNTYWTNQTALLMRYDGQILRCVFFNYGLGRLINPKVFEID